jgi:hypothetical protein
MDKGVEEMPDEVFDSFTELVDMMLYKYKE